MVKGIQKFREHFKGLDASFVVIGGVACEEWMQAQGITFRATKDVDIVLILEAKSDPFIKTFWEFVTAAGYQARQKTEGKQQYYRFTKPTADDYPAMIELFSRAPDDINLAPGQVITPIPAGEDVSSLSAILLDDAYYELVLSSRQTVNDLPILKADALIPLKAKAWLALTNDRTAGKKVDENDIKKHRNDVFRLTLLLPGDKTLELKDSVRKDLESFLSNFPENASDWKGIHASLKDIGQALAPNELLGTIRRYFGL